MKNIIENNLEQLIFKLLYYNGSQSIADISKRLAKSVPNITKVINELLSSNLLEEDGYAPSTGGRRAVSYKINSQLNQVIIAVAIDQYYICASILSLENKELMEPITIENNLIDSEQSYTQILDLLKNLLQHKLLTQNICIGIGISMPGFVDYQNELNNSFPTGSRLNNIKVLLEKELQTPVFIENDSATIAFAEHKFGVAKGSHDALIINMNWGVGLGMIINNKLFRGHSGYAGEFSHIPLSNTNKLCSCGKKGCLEVEASLIAALDFVHEQLSQGENSSLSEMSNLTKSSQGEFLLQAALHGDQLAISALNKSAYILGKGIATLIHILNPEQIVISGRAAIAGPIMLPTIQSAIHEFCIPKLAKFTSIELSNLNIRAQLLGTVCLVIEKLNFPNSKKLLNN